MQQDVSTAQQYEQAGMYEHGLPQSAPRQVGDGNDIVGALGRRHGALHTCPGAHLHTSRVCRAVRLLWRIVPAAYHTNGVACETSLFASLIRPYVHVEALLSAGASGEQHDEGKSKPAHRGIEQVSFLVDARYNVLPAHPGRCLIILCHLLISKMCEYAGKGLERQGE